MVLGTAAYMSPEQTRGGAVDRRADVWAFGCVLFEMLTGRPAFTGQSTVDTLAAVLRTDPDWSLLSDATPPAVRAALARCLAKNPAERLYRLSDFRDDMIASRGRDASSTDPGTDAGVGTATGGRPSIAVLPFDNLDQQPGDEYFAGCHRRNHHRVVPGT
jgi:serine/threonine protein kinase